MSLWRRDRDDPYDSSNAHLRDELHRVAGFVRAMLRRFRLEWPEPQREKFWHLTDADVEQLVEDDKLSPAEALALPSEVDEIIEWVDERRVAIDRRIAKTRDIDLRLDRLAREFDLTQLEKDSLLLALLPSVQSRYRRLFGILQHDAAKPFATVGLLTEMLIRSPDDLAAILLTLGPTGQLAAHRLLVLSGTDADPLVMRFAVVDDRLAHFLFGGDHVDARIEERVRWVDEAVDLRTLPLPNEMANRLEMLPNLRAAEPEFLARLRIEFIGNDRELAVRAFSSVCSGLGYRLLLYDIAAPLPPGMSWEVQVQCTLREARLSVAVPMFVGLSALDEKPERSERVQYLMTSLSRFPHPAAIETSTDEGLAGWIPFRIPTPSVAMREALWARALESGSNRITNRDAIARELAAAFQFTDGQIRDAWRAAETLARRRNVFVASVNADDLFTACRQQSARRLVAFAQRIEPRSDLTLDRDLVLPPPNKLPLFELRARIRNQSRLHGVMGLGAHMRLGRGVTALFVGGSGTGKTLAAEVIASELHLDLYKVDVSAVTSKYIGETEKQLSRVFADAERANCMLFFDEADAMFGHRGEIKEARDRWANLEVNYLLQRIEEYSGVVILATNLRQNIDDAFQRRIHVVVEFPAPDETSRLEIWRRLLPTGQRTVVAADDLVEVAQRFDFAGGNIRNVVLDACYRALEHEGDAVTTRHVIASTAREYQKLSRSVTRGEFGRFYDWAISDVVAPNEHAPVVGG